MAISNAYPTGIPVADADLFVGTKAYTNRTVNYTAQGIADYLNINAKVSIGGQMSFRFSITPNVSKTISFEGGLGNNTPFADITRLVTSGSDASGSDITIFLNYLIDTQILLAEQNQPNNFGHYKITGYSQIGITDFYNLDLEYIGGNGNIVDDIYYDLVSFNLSGGVGTTPNLQQVTDEGNTTNKDVTFFTEADELGVEILQNNDDFAVIKVWATDGAIGSNNYLELKGDGSIAGSYSNNSNFKTRLSFPFNITQNYGLTLPLGDGYIAKSVNGEVADINGNITIPSTATPTLAEVLNVGGREIKIVDTTLGNYTLLASDINKILYLAGDAVINVVINSGLTLNYGDEFIICNGQSIDNVNFDVTAINNGTSFNPILPFYKAVVTFLNDGAAEFYSVFYETNGLNSGGGATDLAYTSSPTNGIVTSSTGTDATLPLADATDAGLLKPADFTQLSTLVTDLASKVDENTAITGATKTKITYDAKGLVTAGADATKSDVGLGNVDNTSDANKPISTATQTALDLRTRELLQNFTDYTSTGVLTEQIISNQAITANDMKINSFLNFISTYSRTGTTNATVSIYLNTTSNSLVGAVKIATATITSTQSLPCFKRDFSINTSSVLRGVLFTANAVTDEIATQLQSTTTLTLGSGYYLITTVSLNNVADTVTQRAINLKSSK